MFLEKNFPPKSKRITEDPRQKKKRELKIVWLLFKEDILTTIQVSRSFVSGLLFISSPRIVAISPCMKAQGTLDPASGHFSPLGQ